MQLHLTEDQRLVRESFSAFFRKECPSSRIRTAEEAGGVDTELWHSLIGLGAPLMRVSADQGGSDSGLMEAILMAAEYGRYLAPVPLLEVVVAARVLAELGCDELLDEIGRGDRRIGLMPRAVRAGETVVVPNFSACDAVLVLRDNAIDLPSHITAPLISKVGVQRVAHKFIQTFLFTTGGLHSR